MKISTFLIYATLVFYANLSFSHERKDFGVLQDHITGSLKNIIIHKNTMKLPEINLTTVENVPKIINFQQKKVTLINFWATWCAPCREEMPSLNELVKSVDSKHFSVMVIAAGRNSDTAIQNFFLNHKLVNLESYKDSKGKTSSKLNVLGLPTTIIVDQHSKELARLIGGADWNSPEAISFIKRILEHED